MADAYQYADGLTSSARKLLAVTPSDSTDLADLPKALYIGGTGDVSLIAADDSAAVPLLGVVQGTILPIRAKRVRATGTTATGIVALY